MLSALTGLDGSIVDRGANAEISLSGATIVSSGAVSIDATTTVDSNADAFDEGSFGPASSSPLHVAVGYAEGSSTVTTSLTDGTSISGAQGVAIETDGDVGATATAVSSNNASSSATNPNGVQLAITVTYANLIDATTLDNSVNIASSDGNVSINSAGITSSTPSSQTNGYGNGLAGVNVSLSFDTATVDTYVNGHVSAAGTINLAQGGATDSNTLTFNGGDSSVVNLTNSTIYLPGNDLTTGEQVTYTPQNAIGYNPSTGVTPFSPVDSNPIGGLTSGQNYYIINLGSGYVQLSTAPPITLDPTVTDPASTQILTVPGAYDFALNAVDSSANTISIQQNGFNTGDTVVYTDNGNTPIQGLINNGTYVVTAIDRNTFSLSNPGSTTAIAISQGSATGAQTFTDGSDVQTINLALINGNTITAAANPLTQGQTIVYQPLTSGDIGNVADGFAYTVDVVSASAGTFALIDPAAGTVVALSTPSGPSLQEFDYAAQVISFNPSTDVNATTDEITVPSTVGLTAGEALVYHVDPNITNTVTVQGDAFPGQTLTVTEPDAAIGGLRDNTVYYAVVVDPTHLRLATNVSYALGALPITFTSLGSGNYNQLLSSPTTVGIGLSATLDATDESSAYPYTGASPGAAGVANDASTDDGLNALGLDFGSFLSSVASPTDTSGGNSNSLTSSINTSSNNDGLTVAGGIAFNYVNHNVQALVGNMATTAAPTVLSTPNNVTVVASISETEQEIAQSYAAKPEGSNGSAVAAAIAVGLYTNYPDAEIEGNTSVDAGQALSISTTVTYPILADPLTLIETIPDSFVQSGMGGSRHSAGWLSGFRHGLAQCLGRIAGIPRSGWRHVVQRLDRRRRLQQYRRRDDRRRRQDQPERRVPDAESVGQRHGFDFDDDARPRRHRCLQLHWRRCDRRL